jgi:hypothetical protein
MQQRFKLLAAVGICALISVPTGAAWGGVIKCSLPIHAIIPPQLTCQISNVVDQLVVTPSDLQSGYLEVPNGLEVRVTTNLKGFTISLDCPETDFFTWAEVFTDWGPIYILWPGAHLEIQVPPNLLSSWILTFSFRFHLSPGVSEGTYPWPLSGYGCIA